MSGARAGPGYDDRAVTPPIAARNPGPEGGLSPETLRWLESADPGQRKRDGQYMTPGPVAEALIDRVGLSAGMRVLDPGVGTGELLRALIDREPGVRASGWDVDQGVLDVARRLVPEVELTARSALEAEPEPAFDLVIGNPPYFQLPLDPAVRKRFSGVLSGRANIFALFFQVGLEQLKPGGTLAYIVPPSMNSGAYFEALREYLAVRTEVKDLTILEGTDWFEGANTAVQLLVLEKAGGPDSEAGRKAGEMAGNPTRQGFIYRREVREAGFRRVIFTPDPGRMAAEFEGRQTLWEIGLEAVTGQVIWNESRDRLADSPGRGRVPLIWSHSIGEGTLREAAEREGKPGFYDTGEGGKPPLTGPAVVVNRVVGAVGRGELRAALVPAGRNFLAENHVNVIRARSGPLSGGSENRPDQPKSGPPPGEVDWAGVLELLRRPGVAGRIRSLTGNTQISARELTHLLPLDQLSE